jgi:hypothetical protein
MDVRVGVLNLIKGDKNAVDGGEMVLDLLVGMA